MGRVSSKALDEGGKVHGIIPAAFLSAEAPDRANSTRPNEQETVVGSMHERKKLSEAGFSFHDPVLSLTAILFSGRLVLRVHRSPRWLRHT